jgi:hypothetical protein
LIGIQEIFAIIAIDFDKYIDDENTQSCEENKSKKEKKKLD